MSDRPRGFPNELFKIVVEVNIDGKIMNLSKLVLDKDNTSAKKQLRRFLEKKGVGVGTMRTEIFDQYHVARLKKPQILV